jgi:hypothetical protein
MMFSKTQNGGRQKPEIGLKQNNFRIVHPIRTKFGFRHLLFTRKRPAVSKTGNSLCKMDAGRHFEISKDLNNFRTVHSVLTKFDIVLHLGTRPNAERVKIQDDR